MTEDLQQAPGDVAVRSEAFADTLPHEEIDPATARHTEALGSADTLASDPVMAPAQELAPKTRLKHFEIGELLGQGGMGQVYRARDISLERDVALKILPGEVADQPELIDGFVREARAQAKLTHPHVVSIFFVGEEAGRFFFAMELVEGESLRERLDRGERTDWREAIELMIPVARALEESAAVGLVHRDIKPGNLLLDRAGRVKVADFGLARPLENNADATGRHAFAGTPLYIAPEQARGEVVDTRADMYSYGASFYHLVAGVPPFSADSPLALVRSHTHDPLPPLRDINSNVPRALAALIEHLMAKEADARPEHWSDVITALEAVKPRELLPGGLIPRTLAFAVDSFPFLILSGVPVGASHTLGGWAFMFYMVIVLISLAWRRRTVGMWLFNLVVTDVHGGNPSFWRKALRVTVQGWPFFALLGIYYAMVVTLGETSLHLDSAAGRPMWLETTFLCSYLTVSLAWLVVTVVTAMRTKKLNLHDLLTKTRVVYG